MTMEYWSSLIVLELQRDDSHYLRGLRAEVVARTLVVNEFRHWRHLAHADSPDVWLGADMLSQDEIAFLMQLKSEAEACAVARYRASFVCKVGFD